MMSRTGIFSLVGIIFPSFDAFIILFFFSSSSFSSFFLLPLLLFLRFLLLYYFFIILIIIIIVIRYPLPTKEQSPVTFRPNYSSAKAAKVLGVQMAPDFYKKSMVDMARFLIK